MLFAVLALKLPRRRQGDGQGQGQGQGDDEGGAKAGKEAGLESEDKEEEEGDDGEGELAGIAGYIHSSIKDACTEIGPVSSDPFRFVPCSLRFDVTRLMRVMPIKRGIKSMPMS